MRFKVQGELVSYDLRRQHIFLVIIKHVSGGHDDPTSLKIQCMRQENHIDNLDGLVLCTSTAKYRDEL